MKINIHSLPVEDEMDSMDSEGGLKSGLSHQHTVKSYEKPIRYSRQGHRRVETGERELHSYDD